MREPLLHFFLLGAGLFLLYAVLNDEQGPAADEIVVDQARQALISAQFRQVWQRPPNHEELASLIDAWVKEEVLYREGLAQGMDRNDPVVRRRVAQRMEFIADGLAPETPGDAALQEWLEQHPERYRIPARYSLQQVYFNPDLHDENLQSVVDAARRSLQMEDATSGGDATLLPARLTDASAIDVERQFGQRFTEALADLPVGEWSEPVVSGFGLHLVKLEQKTPARAARLEEVRAALERDWLHKRSEDINERFYEALKSNYPVRIEPTTPAADGTDAS